MTLNLINLNLIQTLANSTIVPNVNTTSISKVNNSNNSKQSNSTSTKLPSKKTQYTNLKIWRPAHPDNYVTPLTEDLWTKTINKNREFLFVNHK